MKRMKARPAVKLGMELKKPTLVHRQENGPSSEATRH